jgi:diacylglycerol O-acyltransferase
VTAERLSALDASFLAVERRDAPMHVGWVGLFDPPERGTQPTFEEVFAHLAGRLERAPRYRQRLAGVPLGLHDPVWVDDACFDAAAHVRPSGGVDLDALADEVFSAPLRRDRPLWEMWIHDDPPGGGFAMVGKAHHCMVDGVAAMQLANLMLDREPAGSNIASGDWAPRPLPTPAERLARAVADRTSESAALAVAPLRLATAPWRLRGLPGAARTLAHAVLPPAPGSALNRPGCGRRHHVRFARSVDDLRAVRRRFRVTPNDVVLAACAGALRSFQERRGEPPRRLKAMVPADVRTIGDAAGSGNRISFLFIALPCDEPDPVARLNKVHDATAQRERDGEAEDVDAALRTLALTPPPVRRGIAQAVAHPRVFNLVVSSLAGPAVPRYLLGCRLRELYSAVPVAGRHALSIGVLTAAGRACFGLYCDPALLPDADDLAGDLDRGIEELLAA